jgi:hypothetical protein
VQEERADVPSFFKERYANEKQEQELFDATLLFAVYFTAKILQEKTSLAEAYTAEVVSSAIVCAESTLPNLFPFTGLLRFSIRPYQVQLGTNSTLGVPATLHNRCVKRAYYPPPTHTRIGGATTALT